MKLVFVPLLALCTVAGVARAEEKADSKAAKTRELVRVVGLEELEGKLIGQILDSYKKAYPKVPEKVWEQASEKMDPKEIVTLVAELYGKYFTEEDIDEMLKFYRSPVGQKTITVLPSLMAEAMAIGKEWGERKVEELREDLRKKGFQPAVT